MAKGNAASWGKDERRERDGGRFGSNQGNADWGTVSGQSLLAAVCAATALGWAVRFGYSRDGGAFALGILGDGEPYTDYCSCNADPEAWLQAFVGYCTER